MSTITAKAYIPSAQEQFLLYRTYPAFSCADVSEKAKEQDVYVDESNKGYYYLRTPLKWKSSTPIDFVVTDGSNGHDMSLNHVPGLRVAMSLKYNKDSQVVKGCKKVKKTAVVYNETAGEDITKEEKKVTSKAPVVTFGGIDYIWMNQKECQKGKSKVMKLISVDLIEKANPFPAGTKFADYSKAEDLRAQCEQVALKNATEEEKAMVLEGIMSSNDGYNKVVYTNLDLTTEVMGSLFDELQKGNITAKEWKEKALSVLKDLEGEFLTEKNVEELKQEIYSTYEVVKDREALEADYI